eukprot:NODE_874_length_3525_cov_0.208990.p1 type:complete len:409 gc:universal NODE_874_length_3525_cov_0.208990:2174-3400(+)
MTILDSVNTGLPDKDQVDEYLTKYYNDPTPSNGKQTKQSVHLARILKFISFCNQRHIQISSTEPDNAAQLVLRYLKDTAEYGHTMGYLRRDCGSLKLLFKMLNFDLNPVNHDLIKSYFEQDAPVTVQESKVAQYQCSNDDLGIPSKVDLSNYLSRLFSKQTCYDYQSRIGMFIKFCRKYKFDIRGSYDSVASIILKYLKYKLDLNVSFSYLRRANASIKILFDMLDRTPNPCLHLEVVTFLKELLRHQQVTWSTQHKEIRNSVMLLEPNNGSTLSILNETSNGVNKSAYNPNAAAHQQNTTYSSIFNGSNSHNKSFYNQVSQQSTSHQSHLSQVHTAYQSVYSDGHNKSNYSSVSSPRSSVSHDMNRSSTADPLLAALRTFTNYESNSQNSSENPFDVVRDLMKLEKE